MITTLTEYWNEVNQTGTPEAKLLLQTEILFASTEAKVLVDKAASQLRKYGGRELSVDELSEVVNLVHERLACLLIAHRGPVLAGWLMERASGKPIPVDGPGPVVPNS